MADATSHSILSGHDSDILPL